MKMTEMVGALTNLYREPMKRRLLNERLCARCARKKWNYLLDFENDRDQGMLLDISIGLCGNCGHMGVLAYIDEDYPAKGGKE